MSINKLRKFATSDEVQAFLNGGIMGGNLASAKTGTPAGLPIGVANLVGKTLTFSSPSAVSVTFVRADGPGGSAEAPNTNPDPYTLLPLDIIAQIEAAIPAVQATMSNGRLLLQEVTPASGVAVAASSGGGYAHVVGTVNLDGLTYGAGGDLDGLTLKYKHNAGAFSTVTFVAPANRGAIVTQLNAGGPAGVTASIVVIDGHGYLVLTASDAGAGASITVDAASTAKVVLGIPAGTYTGAALNDANTLPGFASTSATVGKKYAPPPSATPPCWTWAGVDGNNMHCIYTLE